MILGELPPSSSEADFTEPHQASDTLALDNEPETGIRTQFEGMTSDEVHDALVDNFAYYEPSLRQLKQEIREYKRPQDHPAYLGGGGVAHAFSVEIDGERLVVRFPVQEGDPQFNDYAKGFEAAPNKRGYEQFYAISGNEHDISANISKQFPGKPMDKLTPEEVRAIKPEHLATLFENIEAGADIFLIDPLPDNFIYDPGEGFGIIDYTRKVPGIEVDVTSLLRNTAMALGFIRKMRGSEYQDPNAYAAYAEQYDARVTLFQNIRDVFAAQYSGQLGDELVKSADGMATFAEESARDYADPEWVARMIAYS